MDDTHSISTYISEFGQRWEGVKLIQLSDDAEGSVSDVVGTCTDNAEHLLWMGAIHATSLSAEDYDATRPGKKWTRLLNDRPLDGLTRIRVHTTPKMFAACDEPQVWNVQDVAMGIVAVDKPPGVPCGPHVSNIQHCLHKLLERAEGRQLFSLHRLDTWTSGCVFLGTESRCGAAFQRWSGRLQKVYLCLVDVDASNAERLERLERESSTMEVSLHSRISQLSVLNRESPRLIAHDDHDDLAKASGVRPGGWKACTTIITGVRRLGHYRAELSIRLVTGRSHQIRAEMASLGLPLVNDTLYGPMRGVIVNEATFRCEEKRRSLAESMAACFDSDTPLGLHCKQISLAAAEIPETVRSKIGRKQKKFEDTAAWRKEIDDACFSISVDDPWWASGQLSNSAGD